MEASPLAAVRLVLRQKLPVNAPDVVGVVITDFLIKDLTLRQACDLSHAGSTALVEFVLARGLRAMESERWSVGKMLHTQPHYSRWAVTRAMVGAVNRGDLAMVQWLRSRFPDCPIYVEVLGEACKCGRLEALQLLHSVENGNDFKWRRLTLHVAARFGHWDIVHWVCEHRRHLSSDNMLGFALKDNNLEEIKWLTAHFHDNYIGDAYTPYSEETWPVRKECVRYLVARGLAVHNVGEGAVQTAAEAGDLPFVQWLMRHQLPRPRYMYWRGLTRACEHGRIQVVRWLLTRMEKLGLPSCPSAMLCTAARSGQLAMVQWIYERYGRSAQATLFQAEEGLTALEAAAETGHLEVVQFLHRIDVALKANKTIIISTPTCTTKAMDAAAGAGHLIVVKWLHANRSEGCTTAAMDGAATNGHLDVVEWLHSNRSEGCTSAAMDDVAGRVFHEAGCRGTRFSCCADKRPDSFVEEQITMLEWLRTHRTEGCTSEAVHRASRNGNISVLKWLRANTTAKPSDPYLMETAASDGRLDIAKWLHATYSKCSTEAAMWSAICSAAEHGHLDVVKWLSSNLATSSPGSALIAAAGYSRYLPTRRQLEVAQYLLPNCTAVDIASAMGEAMTQLHFEIVLLLHTTRPTLTSDELQDIQNEQRLSVDPPDSDHEIVEWIEENYTIEEDYPFDAVS